jgi:hypothetical protein
MFERGKIDSGVKDIVACELTLDDGSKLGGHLIVNVPRGLAEELNAAGGFLELETFDKERAFIAKSSVRSVKPRVLPKFDPLERRLKHADVFDPHAILGVPKGAARDAIRQAYHALAKAYHPDRLQGLGLPQEVLDYTTAMSKRINAAYSALAPTIQPRSPVHPDVNRASTTS